jgi:hypothetical protein
MEDIVIIYDAVFRTETARAILIEYEDEEVWLPKSQVDFDMSTGRDRLMDVEVPQWLAVKHGWYEE